MSVDNKTLSQLITEFRAIQAKDSISPESLGYILQRIVNLVKAADSPELLETLQELLDAFSTVGQTLTSVEPGEAHSDKVAVKFGKIDLSTGEAGEMQQVIINGATLEKAGVMTAAHVQMLESFNDPTLKLSQLDDFGTDGTKAAMSAVLKSPQTRYRVVANDYNPESAIPPKVVGILDVFSDSSRHVITQVFTTHFCFEDGELTTGSHTDTAIRTFYRSYNLNAAADFPVSEGQWTDWKAYEPEDLRATANLALQKANEALILAQAGSPMIEFSGFVDGVVVQHMSVTYKSTDTGYSVVHDTSLNTFLLTNGTTYYGNWGDGDTFGTSTQDGRVPVTGKVYLDKLTGDMYRWNGTALVKYSSGTESTSQNFSAMTNAEIDTLIAQLETAE